MRPSRPSGFLSPAETEQVVAAIRTAEAATSGEIRVHLDRRCKGDPQAAAKKAFEKIGMDATAEKNGVMIYLAVKDRQFAVIGDSGIDEKVEPAFWDSLRDRMLAEFQKDAFGDGLAAAIAEVGKKLAAAFPRKEGDKNELSDDISVQD